MYVKHRLAAPLFVAALALAGLFQPAFAATLTARYANSTTLLPDGNILVIGGQTNDTPAMLGANQALIVDEQSGGIVKAASTTGFTTVSSHTATLLPNGDVLIAGGVKGNPTVAGNVLNVVQIYNPQGDCWRTPVAFTKGTNGRYNHTATLMQNGDVLICGGQRDQTLDTLDTCDIFHPTIPAVGGTSDLRSCATAGGTMDATGVTMLIQRANHTATLLSDGRVFITGGLEPNPDPSGLSNRSLTSYMVTSEVYTSGNTTTSAAPLISGRAYHRASLMGNGKVLIVGGYNGADLKASRGFLDSSEIYDPIADHMSPGAQLPMRVSSQGQVTHGDGTVSYFGGLGNITTTYFDPSAALDQGFVNNLTGSWSGTDMTENATGGSVNFPVTLKLGVPVTGLITDGFVLFSTPSITYPGGIAYLTPGKETAGVLSGTVASLNGDYVGCPNGNCGTVLVSDLSFTPNGGKYYASPASISGTITSMDNSGGAYHTSKIDWTPHGLCTDPSCVSGDTGVLCTGNGTPAAPCTFATTFSGDADITGLPKSFIGYNVNVGRLDMTGAHIDVVKSGQTVYSVTVTAGTGNFQSYGAVSADSTNDGAGKFTGRMQITSVTGTVTATTPTAQDPDTWAPAYSLGGTGLSAMTGNLSFGTDGVDLSDPAVTFKVDIATVVIRKMVFSDETTYTPNANTWAMTVHSTTGGGNVYGQTATLEPSASIRQVGGRDGGGTAQGSDVSIIERLNAFSAVSATLSSERVNHTSTLLPSGKILIAGGSNGPNVVRSADLFDPKTQTVTPTGNMIWPRDLHTATLLPNGRVLVAGGFITTDVSTGPTATAEIYYPDVGVWALTGSMPNAADNHTATLLPDGNVLVAGGFANGVYLNTAAIYVSTAGAWIPLPNMPLRRALHTASLLHDGRVLIAGGVNQTGVLCKTLLFDPTRLNTGNPWVNGPDIKDASDSTCAPTHSHAATPLKDGRVLLTGGTDGVSETNDTYLYTPDSGIGSWQNVTYLGNPINAKRFGHSAMLTPNGKVMIMGGAQALGNAVNVVETYDAAVSSFQVVGDLVKGRFNQSATLGADGYVYLFGGSNGLTVEKSIERNYFTGVPDAVSNGAPAGSRQPTLSRVDVMPFRGAGPNGPVIQIGGGNLQGFGESAGGAAAAGNSSFNGPRLILQSASASGGTTSQNAGEFMLDLSTQIYFPIDRNNWTLAKTTITISLPAGSLDHYIDGGYTSTGFGGMVPYGWYHLRDGVNAVFSDSLMVQVGPQLPTKKPTAVQISDIGLSSITWTWTRDLSDPVTPDGWEVFSATSGVISTVTALAQTTWVQQNLLPNTTAGIVVGAYTLSGDGPLGYSTTYYTYCSSPVFDTANFTTFTAVGFNTLTLHWDADNNQPGTYYEVYQSQDNFALDVSTPVPLISRLTSTSTVINQLSQNTQYWFKVRAFNGNDIPGAFSVVVTTKTLAPVANVKGGTPGSPYNPATTIQWGWDSPGPVSYFNVYNATVPFGQPGSLIGTAPSASQPVFYDVGLATNSSRVIMVSAVTAAGEGPLSLAATAYTQAAVPGLVTPPLTNITTGSFTASWTANGNPLNTTYQMVVLDASNTVISTVTTTNFVAGFGNFGSSSAASQFTVEVQAVNGNGEGSGFLVMSTTYTLPDNPTGLSIIGTTPNSVSLSWSSANNSSSATYEVTFTTAVDFTNLGALRTALPFSSSSTATSLTISGLLTSTTYQFRVQARSPAPIYSGFTVPTVTTSPFNGGVAVGSLGGLVVHNQPTLLSGTVSGGRTVSLLVPANAFAADTFVTISTFDAVGPGNKCPGGVGIGLSITPDPYIQPLHPVFLTFGYTNAELGAVPTAQAALNRVDTSGTCVPLQTTVDTANNQMTAQLNHFSQFQVANVTPAATPDDTVVFPNPFYPSQGNGFVTFKNMPASSRVRIFTLRGELVYEGTSNGSGIFTWGGINRFGRSAASGVYLAVVEHGGDKNILKVVVVR
jgi:hypothetical protein